MTESHSVGPSVRQEDDQVDSAAIARIALASIVVGLVSVFLAGMILVLEEGGALRPNFAGGRVPRPAPAQISRVEQTPIRTIGRGIDLRDMQKRDLEAWTWIDRSTGVVAIPIEQAIDVVVQESR